MFLSEDLLIGLTAILFIGILAQWLSWKFHIPSILLLLIFGFAAGPWLDFLNPDEQFGQLLFPIVSISVAVILFEGGMNLKLSELKTVGIVVRNLISIGVLVTWVITAAGAFYIAQIELPLAILIGAILVVTGPTVILPLLRHVKPTGQVNSILKWEGIINDPIGALLAIIVFEVLLTTNLTEAGLQIGTSLLKTILLSSSIGLLGAYILILLLKYDLIPDFLQNPISLTLVVLIFVISNIVQAESGLLAVTVMGVFLANQKTVVVKHIVEFKENLRVLLLSVLFILLSARLKIDDLALLHSGSFIFVAFLILIVRPAAVYFSTIGSSLNWKEKIYLSWMAPRGIVAAAITSLFAIELSDTYPTAETLVPLMFLIIIVTITIYGLSAAPLANLFGISNPDPQGCLILGANKFARALAKILDEEGIKTILVDTNYSNISSARSAGLKTYFGSITSEYITSDLDLNGIGRLLALTPNKSVNSLSVLYFSKIFGSKNVYQLAVEEGKEEQGKDISKELRGRILFGTQYSYNYLMKKTEEGFTIKKTKITDKFKYEDFIKKYDGEDIVPLFSITVEKKLFIYTDDEEPGPKPGSIFISLVKKQDEKE